MTMEFWFRYHLFGRDNPHKIIRDRSVRVYRADTQGLPPTDIPSRAYGAWLPVNPALGRYPPVNNVRTEDIMSPAVARFLYLCWPNNAHALRAGVDGLKLFTHLAWVAMEVTCLLCEYWRGSRDAEQHESRELKRNQCEKSAIGAAELYFSYFCWRAFGASKNLIRSMSFVQWHQVYMWGATHCEALFPDAGALLMDRLTPDDMHAPSKQLVENVCARMTDIMRARIEPLANYLCGTPTPARHAYFLPRKNLLAFLILARRGLVTDFDSFAGQVDPFLHVSRVSTNASCVAPDWDRLHAFSFDGYHARHAQRDPLAAPVAPGGLAEGRDPERVEGDAGPARGGRDAVPAVPPVDPADGRRVARHVRRRGGRGAHGSHVQPVRERARAEPAGRV